MTSSNGNIFPRHWPFVRQIHRTPVNSPHKGQWRGALMFSLICGLNKRLSKQWRGWWFETQPLSLWRHCNGFTYFLFAVFSVCAHPQWRNMWLHYSDVIMDPIASQITSLAIVYSIVYSDADQRKHQSSASLAFVQGIHRRPVNSPHKWPVPRKMSPFDDVIMTIYMIRLNSNIVAWTKWPIFYRRNFKIHSLELRFWLKSLWSLLLMAH